MLVNEVLAIYSDYAFRSSVVIYLLAMTLHLGEYARTRAIASQPVAVPVGVDAGKALTTPDRISDAEPLDTSGPVDQARPPWSERCGRMAVSLTALGALIHVISVLLRGLAVQRWPLGNMYEFISMICLMAVLGWLVILRRTPSVARLRPAGVFVLLTVEVLLFVAGTALYVRASPVVPALQSYWLSIHVTAVSISSGLLIVSGMASLLYLLRRFRPAGRIAALLPTAQILDRTAYRICVFAFPLYTFAIMAGAIWAESAWGRYWGWDPKETVAFVVWVAYACYLHARATAGWRAGWAACINAVGMAAVLFNLFFVNLVTTGLHSYAGMG